MKAVIGIVTALALSLVAPSAWAHASLQRAEPKVGSEVSPPPQKVQLWFTEALEPALSKIEVKTAAGKLVSTGQSDVASDDRHRLQVGVGSLPPGLYRVEWSVVSVDGHKTSGNFTFTVK
ncbi:MAG: copper homeostasis periplasmic binding protein CopC [Rhodospirillales bacterium]